MVTPIIFQVVGYQNSGKTTVITKLIEALSEKGLKIATIKHHGHGGKPDIVEEKDSTKYISAGAAASIVEGNGRLILQMDCGTVTLDEQIKLIGCLKPDVILIEGHKSAHYPKLLIIKEAMDVSIVNQVSNVKAIIYWSEKVKDFTKIGNIPCFAMNDPSLVINCLNLMVNIG